MTTGTFNYKISRLDLSESSAVIASFDSLKPSAYKDGAYRLRRYSTFVYDQNNKQAILQASSAFVQADELNSFQGNVAREYDDLTQETIQSKDFLRMMDVFADEVNLPQRCTIEVHQMRIVAKNAGESAIATPEGIHQDGFDYVGVFTINRKNVSGGQLLIWQNRDDSEPLAMLDPKIGDYCLINDKNLWHSATNVTAEKAGEGYWDLFVLTAHEVRADEL